MDGPSPEPDLWQEPLTRILNASGTVGRSPDLGGAKVLCPRGEGAVLRRGDLDAPEDRCPRRAALGKQALGEPYWLPSRPGKRCETPDTGD